MLCQKCNKKVATVFISTVVNGQNSQMYLCTDCAKEFHDNMSPDMKIPFPINDILSNMEFDEDTINESIFEFITIYAYFKKYRESYEYMVSMAKKNYIWVDINESTFKWACNQNLGYQVINEMENNLKNNKISYERVKSYEEIIHKLREIRGF